jgi:hypothetical protein
VLQGLQCAHENQRLSTTVRRLLYRALYFQPNSGYAEWQAGWRSLHTITARSALRDFWAA